MSALPRLGNFIGGRLVDGSGPRFPDYDPGRGQVIGEVFSAGEAEIEAAVEQARAAQRAWARIPGAERGRTLRRIAEVLRAHNDELAELETRDTGRPIAETRSVDILSAADCFEYFGALAATLATEHVDLGPSAFGYVRREPIGVVGAIGAWNYPLQIASWKAAPALAFGNAVVFKPSELTPQSALRLAALFIEAGLPPGLFNVVQGDARVGRALVRHPAVDKITLTGEVNTGRAVMAKAAAGLKRVSLELGGKSPLIVFSDADLDAAVTGAMLGNFYSSGEICSNGTRVFVERPILAAFLDRLSHRTERLRIGDPIDPATDIGAMISTSHGERVMGYIERGLAEGARLITGGRRVHEGVPAGGFYIAPTVFTADDGMTLAREEIFGPVMTVLPFDEEEEVIARANATPYGLAAGLFTRDIGRAHRVAARLEAGVCWINHYNVTPVELPFGGVKQSGIGRENGRAAIEAYTEVKSVYVALGDIESPY
jgi:betaine-aldehyde dehydrogenase